jgi:hypothetical protein
MDLKVITLENYIQFLCLIPGLRSSMLIANQSQIRQWDFYPNYYLFIQITFMSLSTCALLSYSLIHSIKTRMVQFSGGLNREERMPERRRIRCILKDSTRKFTMAHFYSSLCMF